MGWLIALGVLTGIAFVPIGLRGIYRQNDSGVWVILGPAAIRIYPGSGKQKDKPKDTEAEKGKKASGSKNKTGGSFRDFKPLLNTVLTFLAEFRRKLRVNRMELQLIMAGEDPCNLAVNYGRAWAAVGVILPQLERVFVIKKRDIAVACDFTGESTRIYLRLDATITVGRLLRLLAAHGFRAFKEFRTIRNLRKGGAKL